MSYNETVMKDRLRIIPQKGKVVEGEILRRVRERVLQTHLQILYQLILSTMNHLVSYLQVNHK